MASSFFLFIFFFCERFFKFQNGWYNEAARMILEKRSVRLCSRIPTITI